MSEEIKKILDMVAEGKITSDEAEKLMNAAGLAEDEGDKVYRNALASLYHTKKDPIEVIKWNGLFDKMEQTIDSCERTANVIQGVIVKNA